MAGLFVTYFVCSLVLFRRLLRLDKTRVLAVTRAVPMVLALCLGAGQAKALSGNSATFMYLPETGDAISLCRITADIIEPTGAFSLANVTTRIQFHIGLERLSSTFYQVTPTPAINTSVDTDTIASRCQITDVVATVEFDSSLDYADLDLIRVTLHYTAKDGIRYVAQGTVSGRTNSVASVSVEVYVPPVPVPELELDVRTSHTKPDGGKEQNTFRDIANGITVGPITITNSYPTLVTLATAANAGNAQLQLTDFSASNLVNLNAAALKLPSSTITVGANSALAFSVAELAPLALGPFAATITFATNDPDFPTFEFTVRGEMVDNVAPRLSSDSPVTEGPPFNFTFTSTEAGSVTTTGAKCLIPLNTNAVAGTNTVPLLVSFFPGEDFVVQGCTLSVTDAAGNTSNVLTIPSFRVDKRSPSFTFDPVPATTQRTPIFIARPSEGVENFVSSDIVVTGGTIARLTPIFDPASLSASEPWNKYEIVVTPSGTGAVTVGIPAGVTTDAAGNPNLASATVSTVYDPDGPGVTLAGAPDFASGPFEVAIYFSEPVAGLTDADLNVIGGTAEIIFTEFAIPFGITGARAQITPDFTGPVSVFMPAGAVQDEAANLSSASNTLTVQLDQTPPTVTISDFTQNADGSLSTTITTSEVPQSFLARDLTLVNGTATMTGSDTSYSVLVVPTANGEVRISVAAGEFRDPAGNLNLASNEVTAIALVERPGVTVGALTGSENGPRTAAITLSLPSTNFTADDLSLENATATLSGSGTSYTAVLTPLNDGPLILQVPADTFTDAWGASNTASNLVSGQADLTPPTAAIAPLVSPSTGPQSVAITLSEPATDLEAGDFDATNATVTLSGNGRNYTATLTPIASGTVRLSLPAGRFTDPAGNGNLASGEVTTEFNADLPGVAIGALSGPGFGPFTAAITLTASSTDFIASDLSLTNATAVLSGSGTDYVVTLTPLADGAVGVSVPAGVFTAGGLGNTASNRVTATADVTAPDVLIEELAGPPNGVQAALIILSEPTTTLTAGDLAVTNATVTLAGAGTFYNATLTPLADGEVSIRVPAGAFIDAAGNSNNASNTRTASVDITAPTIAISALSGPPDGDQTATITLSEPSLDFTIADLALGNATATLSGSGASYTAVLTPVADGTVSLSVAAGAFSDAAGNLNSASNTVTADAIVSTLDVGFTVSGGSGPSGTVQYDRPAVFFFTSTTVSSEPIVSWHWRFGDTQTSSAENPTHSYTSYGSFDVTLEVCTATRCETSDPTTLSVIEPINPMVTLSGLTGTAITGPVTITAEFDLGISTGFGPPLSLGLFDVTGATLSDLVGPPPLGPGFEPQTFTFLLTPTGGDITLALPAGVVSTSGGDPYPASQTLTACFDNIPPDVTIAAFTGALNGPQTAQITLSEASTDFTVEDLTVTNATATLSGSGTDYAVVLTPLADGEVTLFVAAGVFTDAVGNPNAASNTVSAFVDLTAPAVTIAAFTGPLNGPQTAQITLSEASTEFTVEDLTVTNATVTLNGSGTDYVAVLTPLADGEVTLFVAAGVFIDAAGNPNAASNRISNIVDLTAPTVAIAAFTSDTNGLLTAQITLSEPSVDFAVDDLVAENATATLSGSGAEYVAVLTPLADGEVTLSVPAGAFTDAAGNASVASEVVSATVDTTVPTVSIAEFTGPANGEQTAAITLSEPSEDFTVDDLTVENATVLLSGSGADYVAVLTPLSDGEVTLFVAAGTFTDAAGNANVASNIVTTIVDLTAPTVTISDLSGARNGPQTATITLSEPSEDFTVDDLTISNATASLAGSGEVYTVVLTPLADGELTLSVAAGVLTDAAGNLNTASNVVSVVIDLSAPTVVLSSATLSVTATQLFNVTATFSEAVTGFGPGDVSVRNATVVSVAGSGTTFEISVRAAGSGDVTMSIPAGATEDLGGNPNLASNRLRIVDRTVEETQRQIASFMQSRANQLLSHQPDLAGFLMRGPSRSFDLAAMRGRLAFNLALDENAVLPFWLRLNGSWSSEGDRDGSYVFGAIGDHVEVSENLLLGAMLQADHFATTEGEARVSGTGWLIGPYIVAKAEDQPLYFEGSLLWGRTRNEISPFGTYTDVFETERLLTRFKMLGEVRQGNTLFTPSLAFSHTSDTQAPYTDSLGNRIPEQRIELGQWAFGTDFDTPAAFFDGPGELRLNGGVTVIGSYTDGTGVAQTVVPEYAGWRGRLDLGFDYDIGGGKRLVVDTFYDGIGISGFRNVGVGLQFDWSF